VDCIVSPLGKRSPIACTKDAAVSSFTGVLEWALSAATGVLVIAVSEATGVLNIAVSSLTGVLDIAVSSFTGVLDIPVSEATGVLRTAVSAATGVLDIAVSDATSVACAGAAGALTAQFNTNGLSMCPERNWPNGKLFSRAMLRLPRHKYRFPNHNHRMSLGGLSTSVSPGPLVLAGTCSLEDLMASGHVNRIRRPNTWLHRPSCNVKILLANSEPSTQDIGRHFAGTQQSLLVLLGTMPCQDDKASALYTSRPSVPSEVLAVYRDAHAGGFSPAAE
jgi:hypothetical protein